MRLFDLLYGMRTGGNQPSQQFQAPQMSAPTPAMPSLGAPPPGFLAPQMGGPLPPQQFGGFPRMSAPLPPSQFQPPSMSTNTPPQAQGNPWQGQFNQGERLDMGFLRSGFPQRRMR